MYAPPPFDVPFAAHPGQPHAFADREAPLAALYRTFVDAGNAVRRGGVGINQRVLVHGYMGVGKSTLIMQALGMIRGEIGPNLSVLGQRTSLPTSLPEPLDPQRWLILRVSGKNISSIEALGDTIQREARIAASASENPTRDPLLSILADTAQEAARKAPAALSLSFIHRLLPLRQVNDYKKVQSALFVLAQAIEYVKEWYTAVQTDKLEKLRTAESAREAEAKIEAQIKALRSVKDAGEAAAALRVAAQVINKVGESTKVSSHTERKWRVDTEFIVEVLNIFFNATDQAQLPTILVIDDLDEVTSSIGPSHEDRAMVLSWVLGPLTRLRPTCLVLGLRQEYTHEDTFRNYRKIHVLPMPRRAAIDSILAWAEVQQPPASSEHVAFLTQLANRIIGKFSKDDPVVIPFRFLTLLTWLNDNHILLPETLSNRQIIERYFDLTLYTEAAEAAKRIASSMSEALIMQCARNSPIDPVLLAITEQERQALLQAGLLRPAMAGDAKDPRVVLDPLIAYLAKAGTDVSSSS